MANFDDGGQASSSNCSACHNQESISQSHIADIVESSRRKAQTMVVQAIQVSKFVPFCIQLVNVTCNPVYMCVCVHSYLNFSKNLCLPVPVFMQIKYSEFLIIVILT